MTFDCQTVMTQQCFDSGLAHCSISLRRRFFSKPLNMHGALSWPLNSPGHYFVCGIHHICNCSLFVAQIQYSLEAHGKVTISTLQVLARRETSVLLQLLRKTIQANLNASNGMSEATQSLVSAAWDLLGRIIHEGGTKARGTSVSPYTACHRL